MTIICELVACQAQEIVMIYKMFKHRAHDDCIKSPIRK